MGVDWAAVLGPLATDTGILPASEFEELNVATFKHAPRSVRVHPRAVQSHWELPFNSTPVPWFESGRFVEDSNVSPGGFLQHAAGDYYVQDAGSMLAIALCDVRPGHVVIDTCAAPGGKSTALLEQMKGQGCLVANEVISSRLPPLHWALERSGFANHLLMNREVEELGKCLGAGSADRVLVDAPCSGQSMVAKGKQSMASFSANQIEHSAARQRRILEAASLLVNEGGRMVYSTCTFSFDENEQVILDFLDSHPDWELLSNPAFVDWESGFLKGTYRLWPHRNACAGAFAAVLVQGKENAQNLEANRAPGGKWQKIPTDTEKGSDRIDASESAGILDSLSHANVFEKRLAPKDAKAKHRRGRVQKTSPRTERDPSQTRERHLFPNGAIEEWIQSSIGATRLGSFIGDRFEPAYGSAKLFGAYEWDLASKPSSSKQVVSLSDADAAKYVSGESIRVADSSLSGWCLVMWGGRVLSWGKMANGTLKNHFPKPLRQRVANP